MSKMFTAYFESPIGWMRIRSDEAALLSLDFVDAAGRPGGEAAPGPDLPRILEECLDQLQGYFRGERTTFSLPLRLRGTPFQHRVWDRLLRIPYGETTTYLTLAESTGNARATRAVGGANHRNPVSIIVPCHRVIGSDGRLTGYGGGLWRKEWLLRHERRHAGG
jgi:methylated-DNA-[protein]-cysteine S-methyltransferase